jgi:hypothetical protein
MRQPAVAGQFYESDPNRLRKQIEACFLHRLGPRSLPTRGELEARLFGAVVPHAGYMYSGPVASHVYYELAKYKARTIVIMGPNHTGRGSGVSVSIDDWKTPLGVVRVNKELAESLWKTCDVIDHDEIAHTYEHSIEVQLPFLQYIYDDFDFVPICIALQDLETAVEIGNALSGHEEVLILASSDFTHYESIEAARSKDEIAIKNILDLNAKEFIKAVYERNISICGYGPIAACMSSMRSRASKGQLLKYATSGDITGDISQVVAYAAITFS